MYEQFIQEHEKTREAFRASTTSSSASGRIRWASFTSSPSSAARTGPAQRAAERQSPYDRPITSSITSSVPAPIRFRRTSRQARSMPYSFM